MLSATLDLEANPFVSTMRRVNDVVDRFQGKITAVSSLFSGVRDATDMVVGAFQKFTQVMDTSGRLTDLSAASGETKGELLVLEQAFKNVGKGAEAVGPFVAKLHKALGGVNEEGKNTTAAFEAIGVSADELRGLSVTEQVTRIGKGLSGMASAADRGQAAMNLFGKSGEELLALFRDEGAIETARTQVGGLAGTIEKIAPLLDNVGDALGAVSLKFQQLSGGFILGISGEIGDFSSALNRIDLTEIGVALGKIASGFFIVAQVMKEVVPIVLSLGAGWLASMAATQIASIGMISAVRAVTLATVTGVRAIMASLGPVGLAIAGLTYLWMKFRGAASVPVEPKTTAAEEKKEAGSAFIDGLGISSLTKRGLSAFSGVGGLALGGADPVASRLDRTNALLADVKAAIIAGRPVSRSSERPDLSV